MYRKFFVYTSQYPIQIQYWYCILLGDIQGDSYENGRMLKVISLTNILVNKCINTQQ